MKLNTIFYSQIKLDIDGDQTEYGGYDQSNALVLPSKKRDTKVQKAEQKHVTRILSKKQRKNLEKIVDKKKKKEGVSASIRTRCDSIYYIFFCAFAAIRAAGEIGIGAIAGKWFEEIHIDHKCADTRIEKIQPRRRLEIGRNI